LKDGQVVEIEGLAWSGMGTITNVDISFDGGNTYKEAKLKGLVLPKCWTRWSYMHTYKKGEKLLLTSRAMDDAGFIQPTIDEEVTVVGVEAVYHRNAVETWEVTPEGKVNHVEIRSEYGRTKDGSIVTEGEA
jgi:sulfane dehydrogenase subunit SoxC